MEWLRLRNPGSDSPWSRLVTYPKSDAFANGATMAAQVLSARTCHFSGWPAGLVLMDDWYHTANPEAPSRLLPSNFAEDAREPPRKRLPFLEATGPGTGPDAALQAAIALRDAVPRDIPRGWSQVIEVLLNVLLHIEGARMEEPLPWISEIRRNPAGHLMVEAEGLGSYEWGAIALTEAVLRYVHPETGHMGPVDDEGRVPWMQGGE
jgi:hypothetical protein